MELSNPRGLTALPLGFIRLYDNYFVTYVYRNRFANQSQIHWLGKGTFEQGICVT